MTAFSTFWLPMSAGISSHLSCCLVKLSSYYNFR